MREAAQVLEVPLKASVAEEVELDIRDIERREAFAAFGEQSADSRDGLRSAHVADHGDDQVPLMEALEELKVLFRGEEAAGSRRVTRQKQLSIRWIVASRRAAGGLKPQAQAGVDEAAVKPVDRPQILCRQRHACARDGSVYGGARAGKIGFGRTRAV